MDDAERWFLESARGWCEAVHHAPALELRDRVETLCVALAALYLAGLHLEGHPRPEAAPGGPPPVEPPDLGSYEAYTAVVDHAVVERRLSHDVVAVHDEIAAGLSAWDKGDRDAALRWWAGRFEGGWGSVALLALPPLHRAVAAFRADRRPTSRRGLAVAEIVPLEPPTPPASRTPFLGIQLGPADGGVEVQAVHPQGPAAGRLIPGDWLLSVDGEPTGGLELDEIRDMLRGDVGDHHVLEVYRGDDTLTVELRLAERPARSDAPAAPAPAPEPEPDGRSVTVRVLHEKGAERASVALRLLGCRLSLRGGLLHIQAPAALPDGDLGALLDAGLQAGVWAPA